MIHKISNETLTLAKVKEIIDNHATLELSEESAKGRSEMPRLS